MEKPIVNRTKPVLIYDGECSFCQRWISRLKLVAGDRIECLASREASETTGRFLQFSVMDYERSIQWIDLEGNVSEGAEAVFKILGSASGKEWPLWIYQHIPGFALVTEWGYQKVAESGEVPGTTTSCLLGKER